MWAMLAVGAATSQTVPVQGTNDQLNVGALFADQTLDVVTVDEGVSATTTAGANTFGMTVVGNDVLSNDRIGISFELSAAGLVADNTASFNGFDGLRICDASVMPRIVSGNTNAPTIMIAERCAEFMLAE